MAAIVNLAIAVVVFLNGPRRDLNRAFSLMALSLTGWNLGSGLTVVAQWQYASMLGMISATFVPVTSYHFVLSFVSRHRQRDWRLLKTSYLVASVVSVLVVVFAKTAPFWHPVFAVVAFPPMFGLSMFRLVHRWRKTLSLLEQSQISYIFTGAVLTLALAATEVTTFFGLTDARFANLGSFFFPVLIAFIIVRFGFFDVGLFVARGLQLLILAILISLFYRLIDYFLGETTFAIFFNVLLATFFLILTFNPLQQVMQDFADRILQRESRDFQETLTELTKDIISIIDLDLLFQHTYEQLIRTARLRRVVIFVTDSEGKTLRQKQPVTDRDYQRDSIEMGSALPEMLEQQRRVVTKDDLERDLNHAWLPTERRQRLLSVQRTLNWQGAEVAIPFLSRGSLRGVMLIALRQKARLLNRRERDLLAALAGQVAISLENARIYQHMSEHDRLAALGEMAAGLAHEIRNPLGAIKGAAQFLNPDERPEDEAEFLNIIIQEADRLNDVLSRFLVYARSSSREVEPVAMGELLRRTLTLIRSAPNSERYETVLDVDEKLPRVFGNPSELQQVLLNLILNAHESMPEGGKVFIALHHKPLPGAPASLQKSGRKEPTKAASSKSKSTETHKQKEHPGEIIFTIRDEGSGISQDNIKKIFTPFFTTRDHGTGLGLAICQRIMKDHGGTIDVESETGRGATFQLRMPAAKRPGPSEETAIESEA